MQVGRERKLIATLYRSGGRWKLVGGGRSIAERTDAAPLRHPLAEAQKKAS